KAVAGIEQCFDPDEIERSIRSKTAEDDSIGPEVAGELDISAHRGDFLRPIDEVAAARADHHGDLAGEQCTSLNERAGTWREAALGKRGTEFNSVGTRLGAGENGIEGIDADFEGHGQSVNAIYLRDQGSAIPKLAGDRSAPLA